MRSAVVLSDRYVLDERLAAGGMGEVWKATDRLLGRPVAVKLLKEQYLADAAFRGRFRAEARFAARLQHGGIAQVYDYGEQDDLAYLVMELVPGETLSQILARDGRLPPDVTLDIVAQSARALQVAHTAGIIHRDIKPGNLMVTADGTVKITDFGIARGGGATVTQTGMVMGTAQYVAPEQATGKRVTPAADLYSLGVVAYECLTGGPPFVADTPLAVALMHVREEPPPLTASVPRSVRDLVGALLAKDPSDRPGDAQSVADRAYAVRESLGAAADVPPGATERLSGAWATRDVTSRAADDRNASPWAGAATGDGTPSTHRIDTARAEPGVAASAENGRRGPRMAVAGLAAVVLIGTGVFAVGTLLSNSDHTKLVDGDRVRPAGRSAPKKHVRHPPVVVPSDDPVPSGPIPTRRNLTPDPSSTKSPTPIARPTKTRRPPKTTPTTPATATSPPTSSEPTPTSSAQGG